MSTPNPEKGLNFAILASAGTGKTYQLSVRIARLLMIGKKPEEIIALTFTRAAAAEFYLRALERLKEAATDEGKWRAICGVHPEGAPSPVDRDNPLVLDPAKYPQSAFAAKLRELVLTSDRLLLSTLDSFFVRLVNQFALELGLETSKPVTVPEQEAPALAEGAMRAMIAEVEAAGLLDQLGGQLNDYSDGKAAGNPTDTLLGMVKSYHEFLTLARDEAKWGNPMSIWPTGKCPSWLNLEEKATPNGADIALVVASLKTYPEGKNGGTTRRDQLVGQFERIASAQRVAELDPGALQGFLDKYAPALDEALKRHEVRHYDEIIVLDEAEVAAARRVVQSLISLAIRTAVRRTKALHACLTGFERAYDLQVRRKGLLSFSDYVVLLNEWLAPLERREDVAAALDDIHFRLDAKVKHWLLDEFQDTSTRQYDVLRRNIDEVVSQAAEDRSVFVVGDTKQSLYEWRAGNRELLDRVDAMIRANGVSADMNETRRCSPQVLTMVNALLENLEGRKDGGLGRFFSSLAAKDWDKIFKEQKAHPAAPASGRAEWIRLTKPSKEEGEEGNGGEPGEEDAGMAERHAEWIAEDLRNSGVLADAPPKMPRGLRTGVTCAVLVSKNSQARAIAEMLRMCGVEATDEASVAVVRDNPVTAGLFALVEATAHPDNSLAQGLAWMSPTARRLVADEKGNPDWGRVTRKIAEMFASRGAEAVADWLVGSVGSGEVNPFLEKRLRQFRAVAADYDTTGRRDLADFIAYADGTHLRDMAMSNSVQVITIHRSKGLEYGIVYMPCLNDSHHKMAGLRGDLLYMTPAMAEKTEGPATGSIYDERLFRPDWILAGMNTALAEHVPVLRESMEALKAESAYGSLCRLYVGMTRAKIRLVMISDRLTDKKMKAGTKDHFEDEGNEGGHDFASFLESSLGRTARGWRNETPRAKGDDAAEVAWTDGSDPADLGWTKAFEEKPKEKSGVSVTAPEEGWGDFEAAVRPRRRKPSSHESSAEAPWVKATSELRGKRFGTYLHDLFARLDRDADAFLNDIGKMKAPEGQEEVHALALERIRACLKDKAIRELLVGGLEGKILWVERKAAIHEVLPNGETAIVPAVFDRVHITPGKEALIIDYKTARNGTDEYLRERYADQMAAYREAVYRLTGIPVTAIKAKLVGIQTDSDRVSVVEV
jgi:ATP-dependent exoDNAse (exonuclease V) beta subunit